MASYKKVDHLCVLIHGFWGSPPHLGFLKQTLQDENPQDNIHVLVVRHNSDSNTYDGIDTGAERVTHEIEETIAQLNRDGANLTKISVTGYSLGGVIARYTIGLLYSHGIFERLKPVNFTTFASLWIGVRSPNTGIGGLIWNSVGSRTLSVTGKQMFVSDNFRETGRPLLSILADPNSIFMKALNQFKNKSLYANTNNDRSVPYHTASFSRSNPFVDLDMVDLHYMPGQDEKVLLDPYKPVTVRERDAPATRRERFQLRCRRIAKHVPLYTLCTVMLPVAATFMVVNGTYQAYKSAARIRLHESGKAGVDASRYRIPLLEETQAMQDSALKALTNARAEDQAPIIKEENTTDGFPPLKLNALQLEMIDNLEQVGITRYAAHIRNVRTTHAAIIVRYEDEAFSEGAAVVSHWAQQFEA